MLKQGDFIIEADDKAITGNSEQLSAIIDSLPVQPLLRADDITRATGLSAQTISNLRESGAFTGFNLGSKTAPRYRYSRKSFLLWLKSRMLEGRY